RSTPPVHPAPCGRDDIVEFRNLPCPSEFALDAAGVADEAGGVAGAARGDAILDIDTGDAPAGVDDLAHREAAAVGEVVGAAVAGRGAEEVFHGEQVGGAD